MIHGDGDVHVVIILAVAADPILGRNPAGAEEEGGLKEPVPRIDGAKLRLSPGRLQDDDLERLAVGRRRGQARGFQDPLKLLVLDGIGLIGPHAVAGLDQFEEIHDNLLAAPSSFPRVGMNAHGMSFPICFQADVSVLSGFFKTIGDGRAVPADIELSRLFERPAGFIAPRPENAQRPVLGPVGCAGDGQRPGFFVESLVVSDETPCGRDEEMNGAAVRAETR